jgi:hypothetical protein
VAKVKWPAGELFRRVGFLVTNLKWNSKRVARFYNRRGTAENKKKEFKCDLAMDRLSDHRFARRFPWSTAVALKHRLGRGAGIQTAN